jgi:hypothetical protein
MISRSTNESTNSLKDYLAKCSSLIESVSLDNSLMSTSSLLKLTSAHQEWLQSISSNPSTLKLRAILSWNLVSPQLTNSDLVLSGREKRKLP